MVLFSAYLLSTLFDNAKIGYRVSKRSGISHMMYMDDLKLMVETEDQI